MQIDSHQFERVVEQFATLSNMLSGVKQVEDRIATICQIGETDHAAAMQSIADADGDPRVAATAFVDALPDATDVEPSELEDVTSNPAS